MKRITIAVIGLGYVGLPLAITLSKKFKVIGFDINFNRIKDLKLGNDKTLEIKKNQILKNKNIIFTNEIGLLSKCNFFIIAVPTPVLKNRLPDLRNLKNASKIVGKCLKPNSVIVYESTVYPGVTEDICVPILEKYSKLIYKKHFECGYSPERINPGDKKRKITDIIKVVSGSSKKTTKLINNVYKKVITAGTFIASSIKVAEAAKVIENAQRDINIAFINELSKIFSKIDINTYEVLEAAKSKWNFLDFKPGLVGGHCIGVDPYYLAHVAKLNKYNPKIILAGRELNNGMSNYVVKKLIESYTSKIKKKLKNVLILGLTFKEDCNDLRNSLVFKIIHSLKEKKINYQIYDPYVSPEFNHFRKKYQINLMKEIGSKKFDAVLVAVSHSQFKKIEINKLKKFSKYNFVFDLKNLYKQRDMITL